MYKRIFCLHLYRHTSVPVSPPPCFSQQTHTHSKILIVGYFYYNDWPSLWCLPTVLFACYMYTDWRVFKHPVSHSIYQLAGAPKPPRPVWSNNRCCPFGNLFLFFKSPNIIYFLGKLKYPAPDPGILAWARARAGWEFSWKRFSDPDNTLID